MIEGIDSKEKTGENDWLVSCALSFMPWSLNTLVQPKVEANLTWPNDKVNTFTWSFKLSERHDIDVHSKLKRVVRVL